MRKVIFIITIIALTSCGASMDTSGETTDNLKEQVSIEQGCAIEKIKILNKHQTSSDTTYSLNVCGKRMAYKQVGSNFIEASKAEKNRNTRSFKDHQPNIRKNR